MLVTPIVASENGDSKSFFMGSNHGEKLGRRVEGLSRSTTLEGRRQGITEFMVSVDQPGIDSIPIEMRKYPGLVRNRELAPKSTKSSGKSKSKSKSKSKGSDKSTVESNSKSVKSASSTKAKGKSSKKSKKSKSSTTSTDSPTTSTTRGPSISPAPTSTNEPTGSPGPTSSPSPCTVNEIFRWVLVDADIETDEGEISKAFVKNLTLPSDTIVLDEIAATSLDIVVIIASPRDCVSSVEFKSDEIEDTIENSRPFSLGTDDRGVSKNIFQHGFEF